MKKLSLISLLSLLLLLGFNQNTYAASVGEKLTSPEAGWTRFDDKDPNIIYRGNWRDHPGSLYYSSSMKLTSSIGDTATFPFFGDKIRIITDSNTDHTNKLNIEIDGASESFTLNRSAGGQYLVYEKLNLSNKWHNVLITTTETKISSIDAIDISKDGLLGNSTVIERVNVTPEESSVVLDWGQMGLATTYSIKRSTISGGPFKTIVNDLKQLKYSDTDVINFKKYYYKIEAYDDSGNLIYATKDYSVTPPYATVESMEGFAPPIGTTAKATSTYSNQTADKALDRSLDTKWNASVPVASLELNFPRPLKMNFIQLAAQTTPQTQVDYTIFGLKDGEWTQISPVSTRTVSANTQMRVLDRIDITEGVYSAIRINVDARSSWASIHEVTLGIMSELPIDPDFPGTETPTPDPNPTPNPKPEPSNPSVPTEPTQPTGDRAILVVTMDTGLEKEFDLSMKEVNSFIAWYEGKQSGSGAASYAINKHNNNKGPFSNRKDYVIFNKILTFEVSEYSTK